MDTVTFEDIAQRIFAIVQLGEEERHEFLTNDVAKAITMAPYACQSIDADRYALQNGLTFVAAIKDEAFRARPDDFALWIGQRLQSVFNFPGDDTKKMILMNRLAKRALNDYKEDMYKDAENYKYNPIVEGDVSPDAGDILFAARMADTDVDALFSQEQSNAKFWWS